MFVHKDQTTKKDTQIAFGIKRLVDRDSSVCIATDYQLNGPGSIPGWDEIFRTCPDRPWGPPSLL